MKIICDIVGGMVSEESEDRESVRMANLTPLAKKMFDAWSEDTGIAKTVAIQRLLEWFFSQSEDIQRAILARKFNAAQQAPAFNLDDMDLPAVAALMRAVAARFDAFMVEERRKGGGGGKGKKGGG